MTPIYRQTWKALLCGFTQKPGELYGVPVIAFSGVHHGLGDVNPVLSGLGKKSPELLQALGC